MSTEPYLILLADDDEGDRVLFSEAFSELKIQTTVETVNDGIELMEWLNAEGNPLPHFLFLDLNMPRKNGMECLEEIRNSERLKEVFVAIYSTSDNEKDVEETFLAGANVYIAKPNDFNVLKELLYKAVAATFIYEGNNFNRENFLLRI
jgi:CheY-like chemotaxis protein